MTLSPGMRIGPYEIVAPIGAGGMGEVYRATDTRIDRPVALKVLPEEFFESEERRARFEREAKLLASLNHPGIATLYAFEEISGRNVLSMELVEGLDLVQLLSSGPLPLEESLSYARQIAEALEAAHEKGIVHRDLKPANVKVTPEGRVKLLDFGLAKMFEPVATGPRPDLSRSPTMTRAATEAGVILGTAAYMSPEQARGRPVDKRTDIWSFGCLVYECLTGRALFQGETVSDLIARILEREPDFGALPRGTPPRLTALLRRCLRKDPRERLRDIGDARQELLEVTTPLPEAADAAARPRRGRAWVPVVAAAAALALGIAAGRALRGPGPEAPLLRFTISAAQIEGSARLSPDGRRMVYAAGSGLRVRDLQSLESTQIPGTGGASYPFWSPDGSRIGFGKEGRLWTSDLTGANAAPVCPILPAGSFNGATWGRDGKIAYAGFRGGLYEVDSRGGEQRLVLAPEATEVDFHFPDRLGDEGRVVLVAHRKTGPRPVAVVTLRDGARKNLAEFPGVNSALHAAPGHLLLTFTTGRQRIAAVPFSDARLALTGEPFLVAPGGLDPSVSADGSRMTYIAGGSRSLRELVFLDHAGRVERVVGPPQLGLDSPAISPDGASVALVAYENENADLWLQDLARGTRRRLVAGPRIALFPAWSRDGRRLVYGEGGDVEPALVEVLADGTGGPRPLGVSGYSPSWTPDGGSIVYNRDVTGQQVLWRVGTTAGAQPVRLTPSTSVNEDAPALSPDGRWLACMSDESGGSQIFVRRLADGTGKQQVSAAGGTYPFWAPDGRTLYYWEGQTLVEVAVSGAETLAFGEPKRLFTMEDASVAVAMFVSGRPAVVAVADGRFLAVRRAPSDPYRGVIVVENWFEEFRPR